jgi:ubiquinone/menaquinone biosynthesis C-methylase UbiE
VGETKESIIDETRYVLGTEHAELHRLGLQHQVWSAEARRGWELGGFRAGHTLLDLGCGPGFCTLEMAYLVGAQGKVIGVDFAASYIDFLRKQSDLHGLNIDAQHSSFEDMQLAPQSLDGVFCRWALAWVPDPEAVLAKVKTALKPGGRMVIQEYFHWPLFQTEPQFPALTKGIAAAYRSMKEQPGDIDVGRHIPAMATRVGLKVLHTRPIGKLAAPSELTWEWPRSFLRIYLAKVAERGLLTTDEATAALADLDRLSAIPEARLMCPVVMETVLAV